MSSVDPTAGEAVDPGGTPPAEVPGEAPATDAPGDKIFVCPACGTRFDEPTECANGHAPTATVEYDRATFEAAAAGDAEAVAAVNEAAAAAAGNTAGVVATEATPPPVAADPAAADAAAVNPATVTAPAADPTASETVAPAAPELGGVAHALSQLEAAIAAAKNSLGIV